MIATCTCCGVELPASALVNGRCLPCYSGPTPAEPVARATTPWEGDLTLCLEAIDRLVALELQGRTPKRYHRAAKLCRLGLAITQLFNKRVGNAAAPDGPFAFGGGVRPLGIRGFDEAGIEEIDEPEMLPGPMPGFGGMDTGELVRQMLGAMKDLRRPEPPAPIAFERDPVTELEAMASTRRRLREQGFITDHLDEKIQRALDAMAPPNEVVLTAADIAETRLSASDVAPMTDSGSRLDYRSLAADGRTPLLDPFVCPDCGSSHGRGPLNGVDVYRCLGCGWSGIPSELSQLENTP